MTTLSNESDGSNRDIQPEPEEVLLLVKSTLSLKGVAPENKVTALSYLLDVIT